MKGCKLCEMYEHQQKVLSKNGTPSSAGSPTNRSLLNYCNHITPARSSSVGSSGSTCDTASSSSSSFSALSPTASGVVPGTGGSMAANLAQSFAILQPHFRDMFYAAHLLRGYYQPAGPLISPHVLPSVPPSNASLVSTKQVPSPLDSDPDQLQQPPQSTSTAESSDSEVLITGGDLTTFRYPTQQQQSQSQSLPGLASQQQQQHQQQQQSSAYSRSMHQMHYSPAYPPSYYSPYPGDAMCYSPPYQPYFPAKVYQSAPYRRYPSYYQPGPPPSDLYDPSPPSSAPPQPPTGSQLVPAGPTAPQHMEHYPGPPGFYSGYSPGGGQCYSRGMQPPYMEYPAPCPCPMQSCPKNVLTGPLIGSNSSSSSMNSSANGSLSASNNTNSSSIINSNNNSNGSSLNTAVIGQQLKTSKGPGQHPIKSHNHLLGQQIDSANVPNGTSGVPILNKQNHHHHHHIHQCKMEMIEPLKSELKTESKEEITTDNRKNSQYEEIAVPPTPPASYTVNDKLIEPEITASPARGSTGLPTVPEPSDNAAVTTAAAAAAQQQPPKTTTESDVVITNSSTIPSMIGRKARIGKTMAREMMYNAHHHHHHHHSQVFNHTHLHHHQTPPELQKNSIPEVHTNSSNININNNNNNHNNNQNNGTTLGNPELNKIKKEEIKTEEEDDVVFLDDEKQDVETVKIEPEIVEVLDDKIENINHNSSDPEIIHDLDDSIFELPQPNTKRIKILEFNKNQCKKSPPNSYKSLIKQTDPKPYLCLSKQDRKNRFGKYTKITSKTGIRKRKLMLTDQQKKRLVIRKKKLIMIEKKRKAAAAAAKAAKIAAAAVLAQTEAKEEAAKKEALQNKLNSNHLELKSSLDYTIDCVARGYFSEPEIRAATARKAKKTKSTEARSKSETKKPSAEEKASSTSSSSTSFSTSLLKSTETLKQKSKSKDTTNKLQLASSSSEYSGGGVGGNSSSNEEKSSSKISRTNKKSKQNGNCTKPKANAKLSLTTTTTTIPSTSATCTIVQENDELDDCEDEVDCGLIGTTSTTTITTTTTTVLPTTTTTTATASNVHNNNNIFEHNNNTKLCEPSTSEPSSAIESSRYPSSNRPTTSHHHSGKRARSRPSKFGCRKRQRTRHSPTEVEETLVVPRKANAIPRWNNGWSWEGEPFQGKVFLNSDDPLVIRTCYPAMRHQEGDIIRPRDCVLLRAGSKKNELPYVAKVAHLWENPEDGEMMMSLLWYYRPEHTEQGRQIVDCPDEVFASRHRDHNSVACIEDKCYVLTFSEYCRYRRNVRAVEDGIDEPPTSIVPQLPNYYSSREVPLQINPEQVMFCQRVYEFRLKRLMKTPTS